MQVHNSFVDVKGASLECQQLLIDPAARTIVFLHEGLGSVSMWRDFPQQLCARLKLNGLVYSRRAYGKSTRLAGPRPLDFLEREAADVLPHVLQAFDLQAPILLGHSDGGSIALLYASHPHHRVASVIALAPHVFVEQISLVSIEAAKLAYLEGDLRERLKRFHDDVDGAFFGWNDAWLDPGFRNWDITRQIASIACPILAIQGEDDEYGTMKQIDSIVAAVPAAQKLALAQCRHVPQRDQHERVSAAIEAFLSAQTGSVNRGV